MHAQKPSQNQQIPDAEYYRPLFSPWLGYGEFRNFFNASKGASLVSPDRCWILYTLLRQSCFVDGDIWECGVYKGGTAAMMAQLINASAPFKRLHLFDTFKGMPKPNSDHDLHREGDFSDSSLEAVMNTVGHPNLCVFHPGFIPETFVGLEHSRIAFAHIDVDIWQSVIDCCEFIFPRLSPGGFLVFDDYGFPSCPGARSAVDTFFRDREAIPLALPTGQAIVFKSR